MSAFKNIVFGMAAGESEASYYPNLIKNGFWDSCGYIDSLINGNKYLVLGYKGAGKSILGEKLLSLKDHSLFCQRQFLGDFPYGAFKKILPGIAEEDNKFPLTWSLLLLLLLLNSLLEDQSFVAKSADFAYLIDELKNKGLLPAKDLRSLVMTSSKNSFKASLRFLEFSHENNTDYETNFSYLVDSIKELLSEATTDAKHLLVIDGFDDILSGKDIQYVSGAALIYETGRLNDYFVKNRINCKIIILCRTELFEKLPTANKNKQRRDFAIDIDWYSDPSAPNNSNLVKLVNMRAKLSENSFSDISNYFADTHIQGKTIIHFLLEHTRHTPRDFIQLLNSLQATARNEKLTTAEVLNGLRDYSQNYFFPEIKDEMVGYFPVDIFDDFLHRLSSFRSREISTKKLFATCDESINHAIMEKLLNQMFECSAIGNKSFFKGEERLYFRYRNRNYTYSLVDTIVLHNGLWKTIGLI